MKCTDCDYRCASWDLMSRHFHLEHGGKKFNPVKRLWLWCFVGSTKDRLDRAKQLEDPVPFTHYMIM